MTQLCIHLPSDNPAFPADLFQKVASCFPLKRHGVKFLCCMFEDDMRRMQSHVRLAAMLNEICEHYIEQGCPCEFEGILTMADALKIFRRAASVYNLRIGKNQTSQNGVTRIHYYIVKDEELVKLVRPSALKVLRERVSITFC